MQPSILTQCCAVGGVVTIQCILGSLGVQESQGYPCGKQNQHSFSTVLHCTCARYPWM
jgi:hypothetical protein